MGYKFNPFTGNFDTTDSPNGVFDSVAVNGDVTLDDGGSFTTTLQTITPTQNNTISLPNATGTVALVAGSSGQLVYNNAGVYAGIPGSTVGASGNVTLNASSGFTGNLLDLQVGGTSAFRFTGTSINGPAVFGFNTTGSFRFDSSGAAGPFFIQSNQVRVANFGITFCTGTNYNTPEFSLLRDAANTLAQRNDTNAQTFRVYNTYTSSTNYELGKLEWFGNEFRVGTEAASPGTVRSVGIYSGSTRYQIIGSNYNQFDKDVYLNAANIVTGGAGFKIGTATTQKIGFYNATPVVQPAAVADATDAATAITQLNALLARMRDLGLIAT